MCCQLARMRSSLTGEPHSTSTMCTRFTHALSTIMVDQDVDHDYRRSCQIPRHHRICYFLLYRIQHQRKTRWTHSRSNCWFESSPSSVPFRLLGRTCNVCAKYGTKLPTKVPSSITSAMKTTKHLSVFSWRRWVVCFLPHLSETSHTFVNFAL